MKLKQLSKKYPKAWKQYYLSNYCDRYFDDDDVRDCWRGITDFMDKQGIYIDLEYLYLRGFKYCVTYCISGELEFAHSEYYDYRKQAETKAIEKVFKILEERSNKNEK